MLNRQVRVDIVKKDKKQTEEIDRSGVPFEVKAHIVGTMIERGIKKIGIIVCAYVVLDTIRRIAVEAATE